MAGLGQLDFLANVADTLIQSFGGTATLTVYGATDSDSIGRPTIGTQAVLPNIACMPPSPYDSSMVDGTTIFSGDLKTGVSKKEIGDIEIQPNMAEIEITWTDLFTGTQTTKTFRIVGVMPVSSGNAIAMIELQLRSES